MQPTRDAICDRIAAKIMNALDVRGGTTTFCPDGSVSIILPRKDGSAAEKSSELSSTALKMSNLASNERSQVSRDRNEVSMQSTCPTEKELLLDIADAYIGNENDSGREFDENRYFGLGQGRTNLKKTARNRYMPYVKRTETNACITASTDSDVYQLESDWEDTSMRVETRQSTNRAIPEWDQQTFHDHVRHDKILCVRKDHHLREYIPTIIKQLDRAWNIYVAGPQKAMDKVISLIPSLEDLFKASSLFNRKNGSEVLCKVLISQRDGLHVYDREKKTILTYWALWILERRSRNAEMPPKLRELTRLSTQTAAIYRSFGEAIPSPLLAAMKLSLSLMSYRRTNDGLKSVIHFKDEVSKLYRRFDESWYDKLRQQDEMIRQRLLDLVKEYDNRNPQNNVDPMIPVKVEPNETFKAV